MLKNKTVGMQCKLLWTNNLATHLGNRYCSLANIPVIGFNLILGFSVCKTETVYLFIKTKKVFL